MERYTSFILKHRKLIIAVFLFAAVICAGLSTMVGVNYKFADYLPEDAPSTVALNIMEEEYSQSIPNMRVVIHDVSIPEALTYKEKLEQVEGVEEVNWLDDAINIYEPLEDADQDTIDEWYKNSDALYSVTIADDETLKKKAVDEIRNIIGDDNAMSGTAVTDVLSPVHTSQEIQKIMVFVLPIVFIVLLLTTNSQCSRKCITAGGFHGLFHFLSSPLCRKQGRGKRSKRSYDRGGQTVYRFGTFQRAYHCYRICSTDPDAFPYWTGYGMGHGKSYCIQPSLCPLFPACTGNYYL